MPDDSVHKLTTVAAYRANPVYELLFCSSDEEVLPQDYRITANGVADTQIRVEVSVPTTSRTEILQVAE